MRYSHVNIESIGYELAPHVVTSAALEDRLAPPTPFESPGVAAIDDFEPAPATG